MKKKSHFITRNILLLSIVSLCTDVASEMLFPIMPIYMKEIGYGILSIGILEGMAEAVAGLNKVFFGHLSDVSGKRNIFIRIGYGLSAFTKPLIGLSKSFNFIFFIRFLDRVGKGIRTAPRDAILAGESDPAYRGRVFGFHRSMDTTGAMLGPLLSLLFLSFYPSEYKNLFIISLVPGLLAVAATFLLTKEKNVEVPQKPKLSLQSFKDFWKMSSPHYKRLLKGFVLLALINSSNMFLIYRAKELGVTDIAVLSSYVIYNLVFAAASIPIGYISDRFGFKPVYMTGLLIFALVYSWFGSGFSSGWMVFAAFGLYGIFAAIDEGNAKAWLSLHVAKEHKAAGMGLLLTLTSLAFLVASIGTSVLWEAIGGNLTFTLISLVGLLLIIYFLLMPEPAESLRD